MKHILIVEDEQKLGTLLQEYLASSGFETTHIAHGDEVIPWLEDNKVDMVLLDLMLPGKDGITLCKEIRLTSEMPVIMITAKVEEIDRILGLELGANDYICKPFSPREVVARVKALFRLVDASVAQDAAQNTTSLVLDKISFEARANDMILNLTPVEFKLLDTLSSTPKRVYSRKQLVDSIYDDHRIITDRTVDTHIKNIRKKLDTAVYEEGVIRSIYGVGYKWEIVSVSDAMPAETDDISA